MTEPTSKLSLAVTNEHLLEQMHDQRKLSQDCLRKLQSKDCVASDMTGWYDFPKNSGFKLAKDVDAFVESITLPYDLVVVIGIGGSYLGTRAVVGALEHEFSLSLPGSKKNVCFLGHHLAESSMIETLEFISERQPIVNVISKSGTTTEPSIAFRLVKKHLEDRYGKAEAAQRIIATTDANSGALRELAEKNEYKRFEVPGDIGGRYSVLSAVGLVPLALAGYDIEALMKGADRLFEELSDCDENHPVLVYAAARQAAYKADKKIEVLAFSQPKLHFFGEWWKQLFGESEGKELQGLFPTSLQLTTDLHSLGQYMQEGERHIIETFVEFSDLSYLRNGIEKTLKVPGGMGNADQLEYLEGKRIEEVNAAASEATLLAHKDGAVPCMKLEFLKLDEYGIGTMFAFFETACAVSGLMSAINPFDQPGVEAYKKNLFALMGRPGYEDLKAELSGGDDVGR